MADYNRNAAGQMNRPAGQRDKYAKKISCWVTVAILSSIIIKMSISIRSI